MTELTHRRSKNETLHLSTAFRTISVAVAIAIVLSACGGSETDGGTDETTAAVMAEAAPNAVLADGSDGANWAAFGRTYGEQHYSPLTQINDGNIGKLGLEWYVDIEQGNPVSSPLAIDGTLFYATGYSVIHAVNPVTGELLWTYDPEVAKHAGKRLRMGWGIRGIAYWNGKVITATHDGRLVALDAKTGELVWSANTLKGESEGLFISGAPRVFDGKVIIGNGGADQASVRGFVTTYDADTGEKLWRFYTVPGNPADGFENEAMAMAAKTWAGEWWKHGGGGTVWNAMTYDQERDAIIIGVGNGGPWNHRIRSAGEGDNLFLSSVVSIDAKTGAYQWHYQTNPGETWDYNASMDMQLADLTVDGVERKALMTAPKNGFFYVIDRTNGKLISAEPIAKVTWATHIDLETGRPVERPEARFPDGTTFVLWPSPVGAHSWLPMAYSDQTGLVYIPKIEMATGYNDVGIDTENWERVPGNAVDGGTNPNFVVKDAGPDNGTSSLLAWDPVKQEKVWEVPNLGPWNGGAMATAGNLVFQGQIDGSFSAYAADTGDKLWSFDAQTSVLAPPITYTANGKQYVTVMVGFGTSAAAFGPMLPVRIDYRTERKRVLTFALDGAAELPENTLVSLPPIEDPETSADAPLNMEGLLLYARRCAICHGVDGVAAGQAPDLRTSPMILNADGFAQLVRAGIEARGMPKFEELTNNELESTRAYLRMLAAQWRAELAIESGGE